MKYPSTTSEISASVVKTAFSLKMPVLYFFLDKLAKGGGKSVTRILYSLIHQLANQVNVPDEEDLVFSTTRFLELGGTVETLDKAISTFSDLLVYAPSALLIVIDGIERLDRFKNNDVDTLVRVFQNQAARQDVCGGLKKSVKVLFTTAGPCASLNNLDERVLRTITTKKENTKRRPGEPRLGRS